MKAAVGRISTGNVSKIATDRPHFKTGTVRYRPIQAVRSTPERTFNPANARPIVTLLDDLVGAQQQRLLDLW